MDIQPELIAKYADRFSALGTEPRLQIVRLLLSAHPDGLIVGDIQSRLGMAASTLSHHLEKLRHERLVKVRRDRQFLWYSADSDALRELLAFLYEECCSRSRAVSAETIREAARKDPEPDLQAGASAEASREGIPGGHSGNVARGGGKRRRRK